MPKAIITIETPEMEKDELDEFTDLILDFINFSVRRDGRRYTTGILYTIQDGESKDIIGQN